MKGNHKRLPRSWFAKGRLIGEPIPITRPGEEMSDEECEFVKAVDKFRRENNVKFPSCSDFLNIAKSLGYIKGA